MLTDGLGKVKKTGHLHCFRRTAVVRFAFSGEGFSDGAATRAATTRDPTAHYPGADRAGPGRLRGECLAAPELGGPGAPEGGPAARLPGVEPDRVSASGPGGRCGGAP